MQRSHRGKSLAKTNRSHKRLCITLSSRNHNVTVSMTSYVDIGHKAVFELNFIRYRPSRNDYVIYESSHNHYVTVSMTSYVDIGHKALFGVSLVRYRPSCNDYVMIT